MALIYCSECGKSVSDTAQSCTNCGAPINQTTTQYVVVPEEKSGCSKFFSGCFSFIVFFFVVTWLVSKCS